MNNITKKKKKFQNDKYYDVPEYVIVMVYMGQSTSSTGKDTHTQVTS